VQGARRRRDRRACTSDSDHNRRYCNGQHEGDGRNQLGQRNRTAAPAPLTRISEPDVPQPG